MCKLWRGTKFYVMDSITENQNAPQKAARVWVTRWKIDANVRTRWIRNVHVNLGAVHTNARQVIFKEPVKAALLRKKFKLLTMSNEAIAYLIEKFFQGLHISCTRCTAHEHWKKRVPDIFHLLKKTYRTVKYW